MKRKLQFVGQEDIKTQKMQKLSESCVVLEKRDISNGPIAKSGRKFTFNLTEKTAKSNLLKSASRNYFEIETKQKCKNLKFSAGAYLFVAKPFIKTCEMKFKSKQIFDEQNLCIQVREFEDGKDSNSKHMDTKIVLFVNEEKVVVHCYNSTQNIMVAGGSYLEFIDRFLKPLFVKDIEKIQGEVDEYDKSVIAALGKKQRLTKMTKSVRSVRSSIHQSNLNCTRCDFTSKNQSVIRKHKMMQHSKNMHCSQNSMLSIKQSTRNNSFAEEMMLCEDISIDSINVLSDDIISDIRSVPLHVETTDDLPQPKEAQTEENNSSNHQMFKCNMCSYEFAIDLDLSAHVSTSHPVKDSSPEVQSEKVLCRKCTFQCDDMTTLDNHMEQTHGKKKHLSEVDDIIVELTCRECLFEGKSDEDMRKHMKDHCKNKCTKCKFVSETENELKLHDQSHHKITMVDIGRIEPDSDQPATISCEKCDYKCTLNIAMKNHEKKKHGDADNPDEIIVVELFCRECNFKCDSSEDMTNHMEVHCHKCNQCAFVCESKEELKLHTQSYHMSTRVNIERIDPEQEKNKEENMKFKCNLCNFQSHHLVHLYEHKYSDHPESPMEFNPKKVTVKDMVLNLIAEQSIEIIEEIQDMRREMKGALEQISHEMRRNVENVAQAAVTKISDKIVAFEKKYDGMKKDKEEPQAPSVTAPCPQVAAPLPPPNISQTAPEIQQRTSQFKRRKTKFLRKPKILFVGDSIAHSVDIAAVEMETQSRIRTKKAYSSIHDTRARWPCKNFSDVTPDALADTFEDDEFSQMVLSAPTVDISNTDTSRLRTSDNIEVYKQKIAISCENMFTVAQNALSRHPQLKTVVIMEHAPRFDVAFNDPTGLKSKLATFANSTLAQLWQSSPMKNKIVIGKHTLDCPDDMINAWYKDDSSSRYDGVHLYGSRGRDAYTKSVLEIIKSALPTPQYKTGSASSSSSPHANCAQAVYQRAQKQKRATNSAHQSSNNAYSVPTNNRFEVLGN